MSPAVQQFFLSLKIPQNKILLEDNRVGVFCGCPFFLRKADSNLIQVILMHNYPNGRHFWVELPATYRSPDKAEDIELTSELIEKLLLQGFEWFHESEMKTLW